MPGGSKGLYGYLVTYESELDHVLGSSNIYRQAIHLAIAADTDGLDLNHIVEASHTFLITDNQSRSILQKCLDKAISSTQ